MYSKSINFFLLVFVLTIARITKGEEWDCNLSNGEYTREIDCNITQTVQVSGTLSIRGTVVNLSTIMSSCN